MNTKRSSQSFPQGPFDPYLDWAIRNNFRHLRPGDWLPLLVRFTDTARTDPKQSALGWFTELGWLDATLKKSVRVPDLFLKPLRLLPRPSRLTSASCTLPRRMQTLSQDPRAGVKRSSA